MRTIFIILTFGLFLSCQPFDKPKNQLIKEYYNSRQSMKVIIFEKTGNATTNPSIQALIEGYDYELSNEDIGNIFIADKTEQPRLSKDILLKVNWKDNENLEISFPASIRVFKMEKYVENNIGKVAIKYNRIRE